MRTLGVHNSFGDVAEQLHHGRIALAKPRAGVDVWLALGRHRQVRHNAPVGPVAVFQVDKNSNSRVRRMGSETCIAACMCGSLFSCSSWKTDSLKICAVLSRVASWKTLSSLSTNSCLVKSFGFFRPGTSSRGREKSMWKTRCGLPSKSSRGSSAGCAGWSIGRCGPAGGAGSADFFPRVLFRGLGLALLWLDFVLLGPSPAAACCARLRFTGREDVFHFLLLEALPQTVKVLGVYRAKLEGLFATRSSQTLRSRNKCSLRIRCTNS